MSKIIIVGHKNPDTDSVVSSIAAQEYFEKVLGKESKAYCAGMLNNETKFILEKLEVEIPKLFEKIEDDECAAIVDHNQPSQIVDGLDYGKIEYIFDHHNLNIVTEKPIFVRVEPIGSTSSLIAKMFFEKGITPSEVTSKLLLSGILSDMLNFTSPTTTDEDRKLADKLNEIAKLDMQEFVTEMFKAKSSLEGISIEDVITLDYKTFEMGSKNVGIGTWETTLPESVNIKKDEIFAALEKKKALENLDYMFFMVVDILQGNCQLYIIGDAEKELAEKVFGKEAENKLMTLPGVVSRKKQIVPQLTEELSK
ncbi:MAG: Manganese-dependent inorganic pyrophosphatase PpaC [Candidatus Moranbacteria bacterium GW2011_GWC2_37_8]|nr:MAG: Manganese-dependent inorganic pyrophosphatase PpaC [Candidatus Moranbacteria bacterium GW2011_GWC2_37_8]KKQ63088.1 MAG: Manganese-dependent inorganic pyrophosphatase PpaC [Parcubacteria group bacterium GW2011_GWC1_38_22]KKQ79662.1 MAG: Manganese-dependent inorganic pyrophosphatase PpaC [Candidatus Moranbacteria bacterium GW2011_GWD2_38_7]